MAPPRLTTKKKDDSKDNSVSYEGDFFQFSPLFISIIIIFLMIFYWVSVDSCVFVRDHLGGERVHNYFSIGAHLLKLIKNNKEQQKSVRDSQ